MPSNCATRGGKLRADQRIGGKDLSHHRRIIGVTFAYVVNQLGLIVAWDRAAAHVADNTFHQLITDFQDAIGILTGTGFHAKTGAPAHMKPCTRGIWNVRMVVETVLSMLTAVGHLKQVSYRTRNHLHACLALTKALFNLLVQWDGLPVDRDGNIRRSIADFSL